MTNEIVESWLQTLSPEQKRSLWLQNNRPLIRHADGVCRRCGHPEKYHTAIMADTHEKCCTKVDCACNCYTEGA